MARQAVAGESIDWSKVAVAGVVGAAIGEAALYTAGGSLFVGAAEGWGAAGSTALRVGGRAVYEGIKTGAQIGAGLGGAGGVYSHATEDTGRSFLGDVFHGSVVGSVRGAQMGMAGSVLTPAIVARSGPIAQRIAGVLRNAGVASADRYAMPIWEGAVTRTANSVIESVVQRRSLGDAAWDAMQAPFTGAAGGAFGVWRGQGSGGNVAVAP